MDIVKKDETSNELEAYRLKYNITQAELSNALDNLKNEVAKPIPESHLIRYLVKFNTKKDYDLAVVYYQRLCNAKPVNLGEAREEIDRMEGILPVSKSIDWSKTIAFILKFIQTGQYTKLEVRKTVDFYLSGKGGKFYPTAPEFNLCLEDCRKHVINACRKLEHSFEVYKDEKEKTGVYNRFDGVL